MSTSFKPVQDKSKPSNLTLLNERILSRVFERLTDKDESIIQRRVCVWSPRHPPSIDRETIAVFPKYGYAAFSAPIGSRRLFASLSVHVGEVRIGLVVPASMVAIAHDRIMKGEASSQPKRTVDFGEFGTLYDWFLATGLCSPEMMIAAMKDADTAEAVADYIGHMTHNLFFSVLEALAARCGVTYTANGTYEQQDTDKWFVTIDGPGQPHSVHDLVSEKFGATVCVAEDNGAWCYLFSAPKGTEHIEDEVAKLLGGGYEVKAHGKAPSESNWGEDITQ